MEKFSAEQRITRAYVWLMRSPKYVLWSGMLMLGKSEVVDNIPTACTNGRDVRYGREFIASLSDREVRAVVLHENLHKGLRQLSVWKHLFDQNAQVANMAADYVINLIIHDSDPTGVDVALPPSRLLDERFRGMDTGKVFRTLLEEGGEGSGSLDEHDWQDASSLSKEDQQALEQQIDQALRQGKALAERMQGEVPRAVTEVLKPRIDFKEPLRDFITEQCAGRDVATWRRPNRRWVAENIYMPSVVGETVGRLVIAVDTSGSISGVEIGRFLGAVAAICEDVQPTGIDLLYWDTSVRRHERYEPGQYEALITSTKPGGGGGTLPDCVSVYIDKHKIDAVCCVVLTDGAIGSWGSWKLPVLWVITRDGVVAPVGKSVTLN